MILHQKVKAAKQLEIMHIFTVCPFGNLHFTDFEASLIWMEESASARKGWNILIRKKIRGKIL